MSAHRRWTRDQEVFSRSPFTPRHSYHFLSSSRTKTDCPMAWSVLPTMQTPDSILSLIPPTGPTTSVHLERPMVLSCQKPPLLFQRRPAPLVAEPSVRNPFPHPTFCLVSPQRSLTDPLAVQEYDRPVIFADELGQMRRSPQPSTGHKRNPTMPASSRHHSSSGSTRKQALKRSASFSEFVPPHLIARASDSPNVPTATATATTGSKRRSAWAGGGLVKSAPPSPPPPSYSEEKPKPKPAEWSSSPTDQLLSLPTLSSFPPPLPPKDYPASGAQQSGETRVPHVAMRLTARVLGRTLSAAKRSARSPKGQSADDGWVVV